MTTDAAHPISTVKRIHTLSLWCLTLAFICVPLALVASVYSSGRESEPGRRDAAIVLGAAVWEREPSPVFKERIEHALTLYNAGRIRYIIFTGGIGTGKSHAESAAAKDYAIRRGIPETHVFTESTSRTTFQNLFYAKHIVDNAGIKTVFIVSDPPHMKRAMRMAHDMALDAAPSPTPTTRYRSFGAQLRFCINEARLYVTYRLKTLYVPHNDQVRRL